MIDYKAELLKYIAFVHLYINHMHSDEDWGGQVEKFNTYCKEVADNWLKTGVIYWLNLYRNFEDEFENMC